MRLIKKYLLALIAVVVLSSLMNISIMADEGKTSELEPEAVDLSDGEYAVDVKLEGGSGRASINSPAIMSVKDGKAYAEIIWSSNNYDYMIVKGEKYLPVSTEGYSTFEIPIVCFDEAFKVIADTTAMSKAHEIDYELTFFSDTIGDSSATPQNAAKRVVWMVLAIIAVCVIVSMGKKYGKKKGL